MKRVGLVVKFAFHVHEFVLILCVLYKWSMKGFSLLQALIICLWCPCKPFYIFRSTREWEGPGLFSLATGWTVRGSNPGGSEIFRTRPDRPWGLSSLLYNGYRVFPGGKAAGAWFWPPTRSSAKVKERIELYLNSPSGPSWPVLGWIFTFTFL